MANLNRDLTVIRHMQKICSEVEKTLNRYGRNIELFRTDTDFRDSISMKIFQIGELSNHLTDAYKDETKNEMAWFQLIGMRNRFAHGYYTMDLDIIYETAVSSIPILNSFCLKEISRLSER